MVWAGIRSVEAVPAIGTLGISMDLYMKDGTPLMWSAEVEARWNAHKDRVPAVEARQGEVVINVDGPISPYWVSASMVRAALEKAGSGGKVRLDINSPGGDVFEAVAIRSLLGRYEGEVSAQVLGLAASAAQFISMVADNIGIHDGAQLMIHRAQAVRVLVGDYEEIEKQYNAVAKPLRAANDTLLKVLAQRMKRSQSRVDELLAAETWYTAAEAVDVGLASYVVESKDDDGESAEEPKAVASRPQGSLEAALFNSLNARIVPSNCGGNL